MKKILLIFSMFLILGLVGCTTPEGGETNSIQGIEIINESNTRVLYVEETLQLEAKIYPDHFDQNVKWSSSDESVAVVSETGLVKALTPGKVEIIATSVNHKKATQKYALIVENKPKEEILPTSVIINALDGITNCKVGEKITLTATVLPTNATQKIDWSSSDPTTATVVRGIVTPLKEGKATITASVKGYSEVSASIELTFEKPDDPVLTKDWPNMPYTDHSAYVAAEDETPLKIKGIVVHVSPVDDNTVNYIIHNGNRGYYIYAQNALVFPVEVGKVYEVGGFKKNYRGLCEIVDVEYFNELNEEIIGDVELLGNVDPTNLEAMNEYHTSFVSGRAKFESVEVSTKAYNFYATLNGQSATFRVDPAYMTTEEFATISAMLSAAIEGIEFDFVGLVTAFGYGKAAPQIQIVNSQYIKFEEVEPEVLLENALSKIQISESVSHLKDTITIPQSIPGFDQIEVKWESDNNAIDPVTGVVVHRESDVTVTLTVTLSVSGKSVSKEFTVLVGAINTKQYEELVIFDLDDALDASSWGNSDSKPSYKEGTVVLGTPAHSWLLRNALIAATSSDKYQDKFTIRAQVGASAAETARIEIQHDDEYNCVEFLAAIYGGDAAGIKIKVEYSFDQGTTWQATESVTIESTTLETYQFILPVGVKRIAIVVVENSGRRVNIDEIKLLK